MTVDLSLTLLLTDFSLFFHRDNPTISSRHGVQKKNERWMYVASLRDAKQLTSSVKLSTLTLSGESVVPAKGV